jgi:hypothetical protein
MGHLVMETLWEQALHQNSAVIFNLALANLERVVVTTVPFQIHHLKDNGNGNGNGHDHEDLPPPWPLEETDDDEPPALAGPPAGDIPVTPPTP